MIQLNLLPDIKQQYIKTKRLKRLITLVALIVSGSAVGLVGLLFIVTDVWQARRISSLDKDISSSLSELQSNAELSKILTVQNQLRALNPTVDENGNIVEPGLHERKTVTTRILGDLESIVPAQVTITEFNADFNEKTISIEGRSPNFELVNTLVDILKFTDFTVGDNSEDLHRAFSAVVLLESGTEDREDNGGNVVTFTVQSSFDEKLFDNSQQTVKLVIPSITTTRSSLEQPGSLFEDTGGDE